MIRAHGVVFKLIASAAALVALLGTAAAQTPTSGFEQRNAVTYATHDGVALAGDLYVPEGPGPFPAILAIMVARGRAGCAPIMPIGRPTGRDAAMSSSTSITGCPSRA